MNQDQATRPGPADDLALIDRLRVTLVLLSLWFAGTSAKYFGSHWSCWEMSRMPKRRCKTLSLRPSVTLANSGANHALQPGLTRIAVNEALQKRQGRRELVSLDDSRAIEGQSEERFMPRRYEAWRADPEKLYGKQELRRCVESAIQSLPTIYREALVLRDIEEMSAQEAAEAIGITVSALKSRLLRARLMVREALAASLEQPPTLSQKILHAADDTGTALAMRLMRV